MVDELHLNHHNILHIFLLYLKFYQLDSQNLKTVVQLNQGDLIIWSNRLLHLASKNTSNETTTVEKTTTKTTIDASKQSVNTDNVTVDTVRSNVSKTKQRLHSYDNGWNFSIQLVKHG